MDALNALTGNISVADDELMGKFTYKPKNMLSLGTTFTDEEARYYAMLESEDKKNRLKLKGKGTDLSKLEAVYGPVKATYDLDSDKYKASFDYPLKEWFQNPQNPDSATMGGISVKGSYDSEGKWRTGIYGNVKFGPEPYYPPEPLPDSATMRRLKESKYYRSAYTDPFESFAKGGVAHLLGE